jgi:preprotein translocase, secE subunit
MKMADEVKKESKKEKNGIGTFIDSVKKEYKKIVWPTRDRLTKETIAVVVSSVILGIIIAGLDFLFRSGFSMIIK